MKRHSFKDKMKWVRGVLIGALFLLQTTASAIAHPFIIDQENVGICTGGVNANAQEFTPTLDALDVVEIFIGPRNPDTVAVVNIRIGSITGPIIGTSLPTGPVPGSPIVHFDFPSTVPLVPGDLYVYEVSILSGGFNFCTGPNTYPGGRAIMFGVPHPNIDSFFRLGVSSDVPPTVICKEAILSPVVLGPAEGKAEIVFVQSDTEIHQQFSVRIERALANNSYRALVEISSGERVDLGQQLDFGFVETDRDGNANITWRSSPKNGERDIRPLLPPGNDVRNFAGVMVAHGGGTIISLSGKFSFCRQKCESSAVGCFTDWLSSADYQNEFNRQVANGFYPVIVEGRNQAGQSQFRAVFVPFPTGVVFFFESRHGITREFYEQRNAELLQQGFTQIWVQSFPDAAGIDRYQATWVKTSQSN
jgi:Polyglycine hydrolase-like, structural repeat